MIPCFAAASAAFGLSPAREPGQRPLGRALAQLTNWLAATDLNVLTSAAAGNPQTKPLYYETRFTLPAAWPAKRLWLASSPGSSGPKMRRFFINNYEVAESTVWGSKPEISLTEVDISGLVKREGEIRAHVFLCMLAYYVEWHMRAELCELIFDDHEREAAEATRESIVSQALRSEAAKQKDYQRRTSDGFPVQGFQYLLKDLATLCKDRVRWDSHPETEFDRLTEPTPLQQRVVEILDLSLSS